MSRSALAVRETVLASQVANPVLRWSLERVDEDGAWHRVAGLLGRTDLESVAQVKPYLIEAINQSAGTLQLRCVRRYTTECYPIVDGIIATEARDA